MARIFQLPRQVPIVGGVTSAAAEANFYLTGTTTRTNTYTNSTLATPHANPVIASASGEFATIYLDPDTVYRLILNNSASALIYDEDPIQDALTAANIGQILYFRSTLEIAASLIPTNFGWPWGHVFRWGAVADSALGAQGTDAQAAFQNAVNSNHPVTVPEGYFSIESTVEIISNGSVQGGKTFTMTSNTRLERFTATATPILHVVGAQNTVDGGGGVLGARAGGGFSEGLLLFGNDPTETDETSNTSLSSQLSGIRNFKIIGRTSNTGFDGSVGFFAESSGRFRGDFITPTHFNPYYTSIENIHCTQWDFPFHISTDSNALSFVGCSATEWGRAAYSINGYGNQFKGCKAEKPTSQDSTERFSWYFGKKNDPFGPETGCDKDAATVTITGISAANPAVVTAASHGEVTANLIKIESVVDTGAGTLESAVNEGHFQIIRLTDDTFSIPIDTSALAAYASAGVVRTDFYPILGARANQIDGFTESVFAGSTRNVRLMGFGTPVGVYDVANFLGTWSRNRLNVSGSISGGIGIGGVSTAAGIGRNDVITTVIHSERDAVVDLHGWQYRRLDDESASSFGTDNYKVYSGRMANLVESTVYNVLRVDNVGITIAGVQFKLSFIGKETTNEDTQCGEISWSCGVTGSTQRTPVKYKDFQANENASTVTWGVAAAAGTASNTGMFTLQMQTGAVGGTGAFFFDWKLEVLHTNLEGTNLDWDADVTWINGAT